MIRRTILEWQKIPYGQDQSDAATIPPEAADRIAAVAAASSLPVTVLEHGRKELRARGVVGVIAAEDCSLEILPKIDAAAADAENRETAIRRRLVHMLAVALDMRIDVGAITELHWQNETLLEILIRIFADKLTEAVRKGMPRRYIRQEDDLPALRGSMDVVRQFTVLAANPSRLACRFDDLSDDIALNQIMKAAVNRLQRIAQSNDNQRRLRELAFIYADISEVPVAELQWSKAIIDRTNERWRELMNLAKLLLQDQFQTTTSGDSCGFALLFEMSALFEEYVGRLIVRALAGSGMRAVLQGGLLYSLTEVGDESSKLFQTKPDILIKRGDEVAQIIDTKWKRLSSRLDDAKHGVNQGDVYQMMAYGRVYRCPNLMLLYPHHAGLTSQEGIHTTYRIAEENSFLNLATFDVAKARKIAEQTAQLRKLITAANGDWRGATISPLENRDAG